MPKFAEGTIAVMNKVCEATKRGVTTVIGQSSNPLDFIYWFLLSYGVLLLKVYYVSVRFQLFITYFSL